MRIAVIYDCLFPWTKGGGEKLYTELSQRFAEHGHDVTYLTARQWGPDETADVPGVRVVPVTGRLELYDDRGVRRPIMALHFAWAVFRYLASHRHSYDAVLVSATPVFNIFAARAALARTKTLQVYDHLEIWPRSRWVEYSGPLVGTIGFVLQRAGVRLTPLATCHSRLTERMLRREGMRRPILVSPGLISAESSGAVSVDRDASQPYLVFVGRHIQDKRVELIPPALAEARKVVPNLRAVIVGEGPETESVKAAVVDLALEEAVDMPGFVSQEELDRLVANAACLVNPSRREGYGLVIVEAAACGTPSVLIQDDYNAAVELVEPGVNGFIAPDPSSQSLAQSICAVIGGGEGLRRSTRAWYDDAVKTRTVSRTAFAILAHLEKEMS
ncbi:MAG: glycosyltransferase family 4 protein [Propionibacteriaceae bacterium]|jgi:glycosyltransferase involved in cell wall biosynthesis|nr:glycosyltransferase family 4 protein [Propionibacteriaceae bacterium]